MRLNIEQLTADMLEKQTKRIPEEYQKEYLKIIQEFQTEIEYKLYPGEYKSLRIILNSKGIIHELDVKDLLLNNAGNIETLSELINESVAKAYQNAAQNMQKQYQTKIEELYDRISGLKQKIDSSRG